MYQVQKKVCADLTRMKGRGYVIIMGIDVIVGIFLGINVGRGGRSGAQVEGEVRGGVEVQEGGEGVEEDNHGF